MKINKIGTDNIDGVSVIVSTYDDPIDFLDKCLNSLLPQKKVSEIIIIDSSKKDDIKKFCYSLGDNKVNYIYAPPRGLSEARNKGVSVAKMNIIAFTDSDCIVDNNWSENILLSFKIAKNVAIVGGKVLPKWVSKPNRILHYSAIAQGFYSLFDMGEELKEVRQIFGGNFAINKCLVTDQLFSSKLGRGKGNLLGGEETQLCRNVEMKNLKIIYNPLAIVLHQIPQERSKIGWMWKRMYYGGINRAIAGGKLTPKVVSVSYNFYDAIFLIIFIVPYLCGLFRGFKQRWSSNGIR